VELVPPKGRDISDKELSALAKAVKLLAHRVQRGFEHNRKSDELYRLHPLYDQAKRADLKRSMWSKLTEALDTLEDAMICIRIHDIYLREIATSHGCGPDDGTEMAPGEQCRSNRDN
jgi:energy-converting hydrogenase A subunit M